MLLYTELNMAFLVEKGGREAEYEGDDGGSNGRRSVTEEGMPLRPCLLSTI